MSVTREIKCPSCKHWTYWHGDINDRCSYCGSFLDKEAFTQLVENSIRKQVQKEKHFFLINPRAGKYLNFIKRLLTRLKKLFTFLQITFLGFLLNA